MTRIFNRLRVRLTIIFVALTILPLLIAGALIALQAFNSLNDQAIDLQDQVVHRVANDLTAFIDKHENELLVLTEVYDFSFLSDDEQNALLAALVSRREAYYSLTLVDGDGQEIMRSVTGTAVTNNTLVDRTGDPAFENPRETREVYLGTVRFNEEARERLIPLAIPIEDLYTGDIGQVLIAELRFKAIGDSVLRGLDLAEQGEDVYVLDADGIVVAHREPDRIYKETVFTLPEEDGEADGLSGDDVILVSYSVQAGDLELTVVSEKDYGDATALASDLIDIAVLITLITLAVAGAVVTWIVGQVVNPIARLSRVAQAIQQGDLSAQADVRGRGELAELGRTFNDMTSQLQASIIEEQNRQAYLENTVSDHLDFVSLVAAGDLTNRLDLQEDVPVDDLYQLGGNLNVMVESLNQMAQQVRNASGSILAATSEIQAAATQQSASATEQAAIVTQTVATVEEIRTTVLQTAERAQIVADMAQQTVDVSLAGESAVTDTMTGMELLRERVEGIAENILLLSERTQQIGEIIEVVNTIAEQSKLLALNASIEAARAGEEGKGFAVVAMEVRQLAEQSREATARVGSILTEIQQATNNAVMVTEEGSKGAESSMELVDRAGEAIRELASSIAEAAQAATQIAASTHQQTNGMDQLAAAMGQIKQATSQTVDGMQQTERSVRDLMDMAHQLEQATDRYQLTGSDGHEPDFEPDLDTEPDQDPDPEIDPETEIV